MGLLQNVGDALNIASSFGGRKLKAGGDRSNMQKHYLRNLVKQSAEAGIHPLFALGSSPSFSPTMQANPAREIAEVLERRGERYTREKEAKAILEQQSAINAANIRSADAAAARDLSMVDVNRSQAALAAQQLTNEKAIGVVERYMRDFGPPRGNTRRAAGSAKRRGSYEVVPAQVTSTNRRDASLQAGPPKPGASRVRVGGRHGYTIPIMDQNLMEAPEITSTLIQVLDWLGRAGSSVGGWLGKRAPIYRGRVGKARASRRR